MAASAGVLVGTLFAVAVPAGHAPAATVESALREAPAEPLAVSPLHASHDRVELRASVFTSSRQESGAVAIAPDGRIVVAWESRRQEAGSVGLFAHAFTATGHPVGGEVHINQTLAGIQRRPDVIAHPETGAIWITWESTGQDGDGSGVILRRFESADLTAATNEIAVNETRLGHQADPVLAPLPDGRLLIAWRCASFDGQTTRQRIVTRIFNDDGSPTGPEQHLAMRANESGRDPVQIGYPAVTAISGHPERRALVAWSTFDVQGQQRANAAIVGRFLDGDGHPVDEPFVIASSETSDAIEPVLGFTPGEHAVTVAWMQTSSGRAPHSGYDVMVRSIPIESGASESPPITIAQSGSFWLNGVALTSLSDGRLLVAYNAEDVGKAALDTNIHAVIADLSQASVSPPFMLTQSTEGEQSLMVARASQRLVTGPQGQVAAAWFGAADPEAGQPQDASAVNLTLHFPRSASSPQASAAGDLPDSRTSRTANTDVRSSDFYEENIPIPPVWDPTWRPQPPLVTPQGDGPDFGFEGVPGTGWTPADPEMAVGPNHIMIITNGQIACFTKEGVNLWRDELENRDGFWGRQRASNYVYDPEVLWDPHTGRFMAMACERNEKFRAFLLFAVSKDDEPETPDDWWKYRIDVTDLAGEDIDSPSMGVNRDYITLTADFFGPDSMLVYIIDKDSVLGGGVPVMASEHIDGTHGYGVPVMWDGETSLQYMIQSMENLHGQNTEVIFHAIDDPFDDYARTTVSLEVPPYRFPSRPPQRGSSLRPLVFEPRFWSCQFRNGSLWAVHHVDPDRVRARWYEFKMNGWPGDGAPTLAQWGEIDFGTNVNTYFASIAVDGEGNAAITYARSSPTEYISMGRALRLAQDPPGTFREGVTVIESNAGDSSGRWGDYCFTQADPAVPGTFWGHHQYNLNGQWRTWVAQYELPGLRLSLNPDPIPWGEMSLATVRGAPPGSDVYLAYSVVGPGASTVPWLDVRLGILEPRLGGVGKASGDGEAVLRLAVAEGYPGLDLWIQAAVTGEASNVVVTQIAD